MSGDGRTDRRDDSRTRNAAESPIDPSASPRPEAPAPEPRPERPAPAEPAPGEPPPAAPGSSPEGPRGRDGRHRVVRRVRPTEAERSAAMSELAAVRDGIDALDRRIVELLNERAALGRSAGHAKHVVGRRGVKDPDREREVLLRVAMHNRGPLSQADLLSIYRRIVSATRGLESRDRSHAPRPRD